MGGWVDFMEISRSRDSDYGGGDDEVVVMDSGIME